MRVCKPLADLVFRTLPCSGDACISCKNFRPEFHFLFGRFSNSKSGTPPVRKSLQSCAFGRGKSADGIIRRVYSRRIFIIRRNKSISNIVQCRSVVRHFACTVNQRFPWKCNNVPVRCIKSERYIFGNPTASRTAVRCPANGFQREVRREGVRELLL